MAFSPIVGMEKLEEFCPRTSSKQELSWHGQSPYLLQRPLTAHLLTAPSYTLRTNSLQFYRCGGAIVTNRRLTPYNFGYWTWNACFYVLHLQYTVFHFSPIGSAAIVGRWLYETTDVVLFGHDGEHKSWYVH